MDLKGYSHNYECSPRLWFDPEGEVSVFLKCVPKKDYDIQVADAATYGVTEGRNKGHDFVAKYVGDIKNLSVDGKAITNYDQLRESGPTDFYMWIYGAVLSQEILTRAEIKN